MRPIIFLLMVLVLAFSTACNSQSDTKPDAASSTELSKSKTTIKRVHSAEFNSIMNSLDNEIILDVRTPQEVDQGIIPEATVIDFWQDGFAEKASQLDKSKPVMVYCKVGGRSAEAAEVLKGLGFTEIYDLAGGMNEWKEVYPSAIEKISQ